MKFSSTTAALAAFLASSTALALPQGQAADQTPNIKRDLLYPSSINCGSDGNGLTNVTPPTDVDLAKAASRLFKKGGKCTTPAGSGKCIRVACDNTSGIWMCNTDGHDGPYTSDCTQVATYVDRGEGEGEGDTQDIWNQCRHPGQLSIPLVSGQAFDVGGNFNVITGYANCGHPATNPPDHE